MMVTDNETAYFETGAFTEEVTGGSVDSDMPMKSNASLEPLEPFHQ